MDSEHTIDCDDDTERLSVELLDELASNERRTVDIRTLPARFSWLKEFARSAQHAKHAALFGRDETISTRMGSGTHAMLFNTAPVVPCAHRRGTKARKAFDADQAPGTIIMSPGEFAKSTRMAEAIKRNKVAERVLFSKGAIVEKRIEWEYKGRKCQATPDVRNFRALAELKTTRDSNPLWFHRDATRMFYHAQLGSYRQAIKHETQVIPHDVYIFAVESSGDHVVTPFKLTERALEAGWRLWQGWFELLRVAETTNVWPGYTQNIEELDLFDEEAEVALAMRDDDGARADPSF